MAETLWIPSSVSAVYLIDKARKPLVSGSLALFLIRVFCSGFLHGLVPRAMLLPFDAVAFRASQLYLGHLFASSSPLQALMEGGEAERSVFFDVSGTRHVTERSPVFSQLGGETYA